MMDAISGIFNDSASTYGRGEQGTFHAYIKEHFGGSTARKIAGLMEHLQLPIPTDPKAYLQATEGALMFSNEYGVVIRIENKDPGYYGGTKRFNDNPWIIQPLGSFEVGKAIVEICPGCDAVRKFKDAIDVQEYLKDMGLHFWDKGPRNVGILPVKTPNFPEGVPVVIDRLSVKHMSSTVSVIKSALQRVGLWKNERLSALEQMGTGEDPQKALYQPLRDALQAAWPDGEKQPDVPKMKAFWQQCSQFVKQGKLIAGWNEIVEINDGPEKTFQAKISAEHYDKILAAQRYGLKT